MSEWTTDRLALPLLAAAQAQKEYVHNEALTLIDMAVQAVAESADVAAPPGAPEPGQCWIVAAGASGDWAGRDGQVAGWTAAGWRYLAPVDGFACLVRDRGHVMRHDAGNWIDEAMRAEGLYIGGNQVVGAQQAAIPTPVGGTTQDVQARDAIAAILTVLQAHGLIAA